jgi:hypothetical protein
MISSGLAHRTQPEADRIHENDEGLPALYPEMTIELARKKHPVPYAAVGVDAI